MKFIIKGLLKFQQVRSYLDRLFLLSLKEEPPTEKICNQILGFLEKEPDTNSNEPVDLAWKKMEPVYIRFRRKLLKSRKWRYGQIFVQDNIKRLIDKITERNISIQDKVYCDLGCGANHPYGTSTLMYINGAGSAIATDLADTNEQRAAEALYDLLLDCLAHPEDYHWSNLPREKYLARIHTFNLKALREGDLKTGVEDVPIKHIVTNIYEPNIQSETVDIMSSRAVLEHFLDFELGSRQLYSLMSPGGIAHHLVDFVDHRAYTSPEYNWWSFLAEDEQWSDNLCNRLRPKEIAEFLQKAGFEILDYYVISEGQMPDGFRQKLKGRFTSMSDEELSILRACYLIKKPE